MWTSAKSGCGRGKNKYVKEIHFLHTRPIVSHTAAHQLISNRCI